MKSRLLKTMSLFLILFFFSVCTFYAGSNQMNVESSQLDKFNVPNVLLNQYDNPYGISEESLKDMGNQIAIGQMPEVGNDVGYDICELVEYVCKSCQERHPNDYQPCKNPCDLATVCRTTHQ